MRLLRSFRCFVVSRSLLLLKSLDALLIEKMNNNFVFFCSRRYIEYECQQYSENSPTDAHVIEHISE